MSHDVSIPWHIITLSRRQKMTIYIDIDRSHIKIKTESLQACLYSFLKY